MLCDVISSLSLSLSIYLSFYLSLCLSLPLSFSVFLLLFPTIPLHYPATPPYPSLPLLHPNPNLLTTLPPLHLPQGLFPFGPGLPPLPASSWLYSSRSNRSLEWREAESKGQDSERGKEGGGERKEGDCMALHYTALVAMGKERDKKRGEESEGEIGRHSNTQHTPHVAHYTHQHIHITQ